MPLLINRVVTEDSWLLVDEDNLSTHLNEDIVVPYELFAAEQEQLLSAEGGLGIRINGDQDLNLVLQNLDKLSLVTIEFPAFTDGRGFSFARILRRSGYSGQIRAEGDVTRDRLEYMERCGFDAFAIPADRFDETMVNAFGEVSVHYQGCADDERPIFRQ
ncbi:DUF934 domain-containing protein [Amphritea balenae]|uniref:DUF934 domain-containing protein n=1 Tax=Amphritea balenae TaxID=452629 RepID=A0A3P1SSA6_9GAMM|nr:DUF934 domain-containing protein [Amphritea balenae]RRD00028.1 DUF934 domain-containing protein [Amphritea balenae]GGK75971.1 oxidoreductase [Amphritea balenae]